MLPLLLGAAGLVSMAYAYTQKQADVHPMGVDVGALPPVTPNARRIYQAVQSGNPAAVQYYKGLRERVEDGKRAQLILDCIQAVHEERKALAAKTS
jgi:hypothetical protein